MYNVKIFKFSPIQENTYVLTNNKGEAIIIDPGCYGKQEEQHLEAYIVSEGLAVRLLLNTHCHLDHVFGNKFVAENWGLKPKIHRLEKQVLDYAPVAGLMWNLPFDNYAGDVEYLEEGDITGLDGDPLNVLFTPGHSPGSISFYAGKQGFVISGDVLFQGNIGRTDLPLGDFETLSASIREKIYTLPDETVVYSGHGEPTKVGTEKRTNPFVKLAN
jgi:glyoxylase-like metal-dependent hydrolase (beta-lactamase superfamily II)